MICVFNGEWVELWMVETEHAACRRSAMIKVSPQLTNWRQRLSKHGRNYQKCRWMASSLECVVRQCGGHVEHMFWHVKYWFVWLFYCCEFVVFIICCNLRNLLLPFVTFLRLVSFARWAPLYFLKLVRINYVRMFTMKWLIFVPNLVQIWSIFLKLQAVTQSGPVFWAYPVVVLFGYQILSLIALWPF